MAKEELTIGFANWFNGFREDTKMFSTVTSKLFPDSHIKILEHGEGEPDIGVSSVFGQGHIPGKIKLALVGENWNVGYLANNCHFMLSHFHDDKIGNCENLNWPLFSIYYDLEKLKEKTNLITPEFVSEKKKFCCFIVTNPNGQFRNACYKSLSEYKKVDSGGKYLNNIGYVVEGGHSSEQINKFIGEYKFCICMENSAFPGYCTEKIVQTMMANTIPIYWGDPTIQRYFRPESFIWAQDIKAMLAQVKILDNDSEAYLKKLQEPWVTDKFYDKYKLNQLTLFGQRILWKLN